MTGTLETVSASTRALGVIQDIPLWLLTAVAVFLWVLPFLPGADDFVPPTSLNGVRLAGVLFTILAVCRLGSGLVPVIRDWWIRGAVRRPVHLTFIDSQSFWLTTKQPDGSIVTQFTLRFMVKNLTEAPVHLLKARVIRPKIRGEILQDMVLVRGIQENAYSSAQVSGHYIPPQGLLPVSVGIFIRGTPKQTVGRMQMLIGVADANGNETRVKLDVKGVG